MEHEASEASDRCSPGGSTGYCNGSVLSEGHGRAPNPWNYLELGPAYSEMFRV